MTSKEVLKDYGNFKADSTRKLMQVRASYAQGVALVKYLADDCRVFRPQNQHLLQDNVTNKSDRNGWLGGLVSDLDKTPDLTEYKRTLKEITRSGLLDRLNAGVGNKKTRRRTNSEHDGEWNMDRQWDIAPFTLAKSQDTAAKSLTLTVDFCFNCMTEAADIAKYGVTCAAIVGLVESRGYVVKVIARKAGSRFAQNSPYKYEQLITIKEPGEYLNPGRILQAFSPLFMRRVMFAYINAGAEYMGKDVQGNYGIPERGNDPITQSKGHVGLHNIKAGKDMAGITEAIVKAIA